MSEPAKKLESLSARLGAIGVNGRISADEVLFLRRNVFADGVVSSEELDAVFDLAARSPDGDPEWAQFFAEIVADFYLREEEPHGYLTQEEFETLQARVLRDKLASPLELTLLVKIMETASATPPAMSAFVGEEIKRAVTEKAGGPSIDRREIGLLKRWLFAAGGGGAVAVTKPEAELFFDLNDALRAEDDNDAWVDAFSTAIVNHLMAHLGYEAVSREEAFRLHAEMSDHAVDLAGFVKRMAEGRFSGFRTLFSKEKSLAEQAAERREAGARDAAKVTPEEAEWLAARIGRDGVFSAAEKETLRRMRELAGPLPESLRALMVLDAAATPDADQD